MWNANSFWDILSAYLGYGMVVVLAFTGVMLLWLRMDGKIQKWMILCGVIGILLVYNGLTYYVVARFGEGATYYRTLWMIPVVLLAAVAVMVVWNHIKTSGKRGVFILLMCGTLIGGGCIDASDLQWPDNVYQMDVELLEVCDIIIANNENISEECNDHYIVFAEQKLTRVIREYDARALVSYQDVEPTYYDFVLGYYPEYSTEQVKENVPYWRQSYTILLRTQTAEMEKVLEAGMRLVGETEHYMIYYYLPAWYC